MQVANRFKSAWVLLKKAGSEWSDDQASMQGAALAYYTIFSVAPLLIIAIAVAGLAFGEEATRGQLFSTLEGFIGAQGAEGIQAMVQGAAGQPRTGIVATVVGLVTLLLGASGVFAQLQQSLDLIWKVQPRRSLGFKSLIRQRLLSFSMVLVIAFLLLVSLVVSAGLAAMGKFVGETLPGGEAIWQGVNALVSFGVITVLFASIYKVLPDVRLRWRDTFIGAAVTAFLFTVGKFAIGTYLGKSGVASTYGAAASVIVVLLWVYYSSLILYYGAEFTKVYATRNGRVVEPKHQAEAVVLNGMQPQFSGDSLASRPLTTPPTAPAHPPRNGSAA